jgi:preprotein translocase subunit Sss1
MEMEEAASMMSKIGTLFKILGAVGFVVTIICALIEVVEGEEQ